MCQAGPSEGTGDGAWIDLSIEKLNKVVPSNLLEGLVDGDLHAGRWSWLAGRERP